VRRPLVRLSALLLLSGTALVATAPPCFACGCVPQTAKQVFRRADAAFVGEVTSQRPLDAMTTAQTFRVDAVYKGALHSSVDVVASMGAAGGSDCAILFPEASPVAVILQQQGDHWISDACSLLTLAELRRVAPPGEPPLPGEGPPAGGPAAPPTASPAPGTSEGSGGGGISGAGAIAGGLLAIAAIAFVLSLESRRAARDRRSREPDDGALEPEGSAPESAGPEAADPPEPSG
jgi:hypothetical protein